MTRHLLWASVVCWIVIGCCSAEVLLPHVLSDHAVLQRNQPIRIWGWSNPSEKVTVKFHDQTVASTADTYGSWEAWLKPETAGGPYTLIVLGTSSANPLERVDILVGDVWIASGQSNMEFPLVGFTGAPLKNGEAEVADAKQPNLRILLQKQRVSAVPMSDSDDTWKECTPETAREFSAIAYLFGREISAKNHVPVGLIDVTWGGTPAQAWMSLGGIAYASLPSIAIDAARVAREQGRADEIRTVNAAQDLALKAAGKPVVPRDRIPNDHRGSWSPAALYNAMISPYTKYAIKGAIWYQGETDATTDRAPNYARVFAALIQDWRNQWSEGPFPFLFVQLSSYGDDVNWGSVRDGQRRTLALENTGMAVSIDVGVTNNIHPPDKQTIAARLAQTALGMVYGKNIEFRSPTFVEATSEGGSIRVWFTHAEGLTSKNDVLDDFEVAGEDHTFMPATGKIEKTTVLVTSPSITAPKYVRYGWKGTVTNWFYNSAGLPAGSFTSEP
jgi:sialate O-acetylesterase